MLILNTVDKFVKENHLEQRHKDAIEEYFYEIAKESLERQTAIRIEGSSMAIAVFYSNADSNRLIVVPLFHSPYAATNHLTPVYRMLLYLFHFKPSRLLSEQLTQWAKEKGFFYNALPLPATLLDVYDRWNMSLKRYTHFAYSPEERRYVLQLYRRTKGFTKYFNHFRRRKSFV